MIIIVEGIDRVGKSTLCQKLSKELGIEIFKRYEYQKFSEMDNDNETDKMLQLLQMVKLTKSDIIFDRLYLSDFAYGTLERCYDETHAMKNFDVIDSLASSFEDDVTLICIMPTNIYESSKQHGKSLELHNINFKLLFSRSKIRNKIMCNYTTIDEVVEMIKREYKEC